MPQTDLRRAFDAYYQEEARRAARRGFRAAARAPRGSAQPLRYDESGFPIPAGPPNLTQRLRRLVED